MVHKGESVNISLRKINKKNILKIVLEKGSISRTGISKYLKISRPTTSSYIYELIKEGLVEEKGKSKSTPAGGRKAILLNFNRKAGYILGVMIGVETIRIALSDLVSNIIRLIKIPTEEWEGPEVVIENIVKNLKELIKESGISKENFIGVGIGATGLVDSKTGDVIFSPNLKGWNNIRLKEIMEKKMDLPTFIENECRIQAIAEKKFGLAKNIKNFVCVETGIGIGTGVFINNRLLVGNKGIAGEVGHIIANITGYRLCHCGNMGCIETLCSTRSLLEDIKNDFKKIGNKSSDIKRLEIKDIYNLYKQGSEIVVQNVEKNAEYLGIAVSNIIKMFNPEIIIIHGEAIKFGEKYLDLVKKSVAKKTFPKVKDVYNIQFSRLGEEIGIMGATSFVFTNIINLENLNIAEYYIIKKT
ncbi:N-acetylglucosamine repressor [subsurface metagenome]|nr:ROK family protein [Clostridia bacterium]